jgi:actin-related protein
LKKRVKDAAAVQAAIAAAAVSDIDEDSEFESSEKAPPAVKTGIVHPAVDEQGKEESIHEAQPQAEAVLASSPQSSSTAATASQRVVSLPTLLASHALSSPGYLPRHPLSRGHFNLSPGTSLRQCVDHMEEALLRALDECLSVSASQIGRYSLSLAVPDCWSQRELAEYISMLLGPRVGFRELILHRESSLCVFGAGLASACVVDLGAETTRISCVEEGAVLPLSVVELNYGGKQIEQLLEMSIQDKAYWGEVEAKRRTARTHAEAERAALEQSERVRKWKETYCYCLLPPSEDGDEDDSTPAAASSTAGGAVVQPSLAGAAAAAAAAAAARRAASHAALGGSLSVDVFGGALATLLPPAAPRGAPASVPQELMFAAAIAPLGLFHPSLFLSDLGLHSESAREILSQSAHLDPLAEQFFTSDSPFYPFTSAAIEASTRSQTRVQFNRTHLFEVDEIMLPGGEISRADSNWERNRKKDGKRRRVETEKAAQTSAALSGAAGSTAASADKSSPAKASQPFKLDRRRKDHQLLLLDYSEEQLMAGMHLAPDAPHKKRAEEEAAAAEAKALAKAAEKAAEKAAQQAAHMAMQAAPSPLPASASSSTDSISPLTPVESFLSSRLPLHVALSTSLRRLPTLDLQVRMASSILLCGGGSSLPRLSVAFEQRLVDTVPYLLTGVNTVNCITQPRGGEGQELSWRGAAILAKAEGAKEMVRQTNNSRQASIVNCKEGVNWMLTFRWRSSLFAVLRTCSCSVVPA